MKVLIIGGGPAGLYAGLLLKKADPSREIVLMERNPRGATYGWGVVFSDRTLHNFREADVVTYEAITDAFVLWDAIDIHYKGRVLRCGGNVFAGMARRRLLQILEDRCNELGVSIAHDAEIQEANFDGYDLVIAADGINSTIRPMFADSFKPSYEVGKAKYIWFGTHHVFDSFTFSIKLTEYGTFQAHAYPFDGETSTFIVECDEQTWRNAGLDAADEAQSITFCESLFVDDLSGDSLMSNNSKWINFVTVKNRRWRHNNIVLLGDAAHTAHFSIGSGTKLAMEDAIALARAFEVQPTVSEALTHYELERKPRVTTLQDAAQESQDYFETLGRFTHLEPEQFAFHLLTRSGRLNYDNLKLRDHAFVDRVERWFFERASTYYGPPLIAPPPLFAPLQMGKSPFHSRVIFAAPHSDDALDGIPNAAECDRLMRLALGRPALVMTQPIAVSPDGRITMGTPALYSDAQQSAWTAILQAVRGDTHAKVGVELIHAGRRGAAQSRVHGLDRPLTRGAWPLLAASAIPYASNSQTPKAMDRSERDTVCQAFVAAAKRADAARFDALSINMAHGYLLSSFLSPLTNQRDDEYGGSAENRMRFPLEVFDAVRAAWPHKKPLFVSLNATDWHKGGVMLDEVITFAAALKSRGCDLIRPMAGYTTPNFDPDYRSDYLTNFCERIRSEVGIAVMASGGITTTNHANSILAGGRADLILMDRPIHS